MRISQLKLGKPTDVWALEHLTGGIAAVALVASVVQDAVGVCDCRARGAGSVGQRGSLVQNGLVIGSPIQLGGRTKDNTLVVGEFGARGYTVVVLVDTVRDHVVRANETDAEEPVPALLGIGEILPSLVRAYTRSDTGSQLDVET